MGYIVYKIDELSSLTTAEYIELKSTLNALDNRQFLCGECVNKYAERADYDAMSAKYREGKACEKPSHRDLYRVDDIMFRKCSGNYVDMNSIYLIEAYNMYEKGSLPFPGTYLEQPHKVIDSFRVIGNYKTQKMLDEQKKQASKSKQVSRGR